MLRVLSASLRSVGEMQLRNSREAAVGCPFKATSASRRAGFLRAPAAPNPLHSDQNA
jgi:hypothetical protein